ncbi:MAG: MBL fold metallo-hydrolase [Nitrospirae bacterium]|nr:MBL fold metallo-hydrolase [Nitrospirota bacterium]
MRFGQIETHTLTDGLFRLDGGAMFGIVPKPLWEKTNPPDDRNRVRMNLGVLLIRAHGKNILVDTGAGGKMEPKWQEIYALERRPNLEESLAKLRLTPNDIDIVINTHLHFDHAGGNTFRDVDGQIVPTFPKARYFVQKGEWDWAHTKHERTQYAYFKDDFSPLERSGRLTLLKGDEEILGGIRVLVTPGHTEFHQCALVESEGQKAIFLGDLIPMVSHLPYPYVMGYDLFPLKTLETKKKILQQSYDEHWLLIFQHDPDTSMGYLKKADGKFALEAVRDATD